VKQAVQGDLFDPVLPGRRHQALSSLAAVWAAIAGTPTLRGLAQEAWTAAHGRGGNRGAGEAFEAELAARLDRPAQLAISAEAVAALDPAAAPALPELLAVRWEHLEGARPPADFIATLTFEGCGVLEVPVNLKVRNAAAPQAVGDACALRTLLRVAMGRSVLGGDPVDVPRALLRWWAGRERIQAADYVLLTVEVDGDAVVGVCAQGLLSAVTEGGELALTRNSTREVAQARPAAGVVPPGMDLNWEFAGAVSPVVTGSDVRLAVLLWLADVRGWDRDRVAAVAASLDDVGDAELAQVLAGAVPGGLSAGPSEG
jgi:hypothetical protein